MRGNDLLNEWGEQSSGLDIPDLASIPPFRWPNSTYSELLPKMGVCYVGIYH